MKLSLWLAGIILTTTCVLMFVLVLDAEAFRDQSLAVLNAFFAYPIVAYSIFLFYQVRTSFALCSPCWSRLSIVWGGLLRIRMKDALERKKSMHHI